MNTYFPARMDTYDGDNRDNRGISGTFRNGIKLSDKTFYPFMLRYNGTSSVLTSEEDTIRPRLNAAGANVKRVYALLAVRHAYKEDSTKEWVFSLETDLLALEAAILATPGCRLIIIDPITAYLGGTDSHKNAEIRGLIAPLAALAAKHRIAVVCVTHLNKSRNGPAIYRSIGSSAFAAAARAVWAVTKDRAILGAG
jgi:AAA domain